MKPRTDQIRFLSSSNGQIILDAYIEAAEKGGRSLGDLLSDLFDGQGIFRTDIFEFRENPAVAGQLQARVGDFADPNAGWANISSTSFQSFVDACAASQVAAAGSAASAASSASTADAHKLDAQAAKTAFEAARDLSNTYKTASETARSASQLAQSMSENARDLAQKWASEIEDVAVQSGLFSARHHAAKALASSVAAGGSAVSAQTSANTATTKAGEASTSAGTAYAAQVAAEDARDLTLGYRNTANTERLAAEAARDLADGHAAAAAASEGIASTKAGEASASASDALASRNVAETKASEAAASATLAQGYADTVNPTNFYTKSAADDLLDAKADQATTYTMAEVAALIQAGGVPIGASIMWNSLTLPPGFLKENGAAISRTVYPELFAKIGTTHGAGDGSTTFNVPDSRGVVVRGLDDGRGLDPGRVIGSYQADQNQSHTHGVNDPGHYHGYSSVQTLGYDGVLDAGSNTANWQDAGQLGANTYGALTGIYLSASGGTEARMKNTAKLILIRAF